MTMTSAIFFFFVIRYDSKSIDPSTRSLNKFSELIDWMKINLIAPTTNAISESSFSTLNKDKTSIRSTMADFRLNYLLMI